jgi:hypothetical protein
MSGIRTHDPSVKRVKTVHALDRAATVISISVICTHTHKKIKIKDTQYYLQGNKAEKFTDISEERSFSIFRVKCRASKQPQQAYP